MTTYRGGFLLTKFDLSTPEMVAFVAFARLPSKLFSSSLLFILCEYILGEIQNLEVHWNTSEINRKNSQKGNQLYKYKQYNYWYSKKIDSNKKDWTEKKLLSVDK